MGTVETKTGKSFQCDYFFVSPTGETHMRLHDISFIEAANVFSDADETGMISYTFGSVNAMSLNSTNLMVLARENDGIRIVLVR